MRVHFIRSLFGGTIVPMILEIRTITVTNVLSGRYKENDFIIKSSIEMKNM